MCCIDSVKLFIANFVPRVIKKHVRNRWINRLFLAAACSIWGFQGCLWNKTANSGNNGGNAVNPETLSEREIDSLAVRALLDANGMEVKEVADYVSWSKNRITTLDLSNTQVEKLTPHVTQLSHLSQLRIVNTPLHILPDSLWKLKELKILILSANKLDSLPGDFIHFTKLSNIDISHNQLNDVHFNFARLGDLLFLNLSHNNLKTLPATLGSAFPLQKLNLESNQIQVLDDSLVYVKNLDTLILRRNRIKALPLNLEAFFRLKVLDVSENELELLPASITKITRLEFLGLSNNKLKALPDSIFKFDVLKALHADGNQLSSIPESLGRLRALNTLHLQHNLIKTLPHSLGDLKTLKELFLNDNKLVQIPYTFGKLTNLEQLGLIGNDIQFLPPQISQLENLANLVLDEKDKICAISHEQMDFINAISNFNLPLCSLDTNGLFPTYIGNNRNNRVFGKSILIAQPNPQYPPRKMHPKGIYATFFNLKGEIMAREEADTAGNFEVMLPRGTFTGGLTLRDSGKFIHRSFCFDTLVLTNINDSFALGSFTFQDEGPRECNAEVFPPGTIFNLSLFGEPDTVLEIPYVDYPLDSSEVRYILTKHCNMMPQMNITPDVNTWHVSWGIMITALDNNQFTPIPEFQAEVSRIQSKRSITCKTSPSPLMDKKDNDGDGCVDEEVIDGKDNDGDGIIDEDPRKNYTDENGNTLTLASLLHPDSSGMGQLNLDGEDRLIFTKASDFWVDSVYNTEKRIKILSYGITPSHEVRTDIGHAQRMVGGCWRLYDSLFKPVRFAVNRFDGKDTVKDLYGIQYPLDSLSATRAAMTACNTNLNSANWTYSSQKWLFTWGDSLISLSDTGFVFFPEFQIIVNGKTPEIDCRLAPSQKADGKDNDGDGCIDEERLDSIDNDGDGIVDEDLGISPYDTTAFNSLLNPDSLSGEMLAIDSTGRLEFTKEAGFWAIGGKLPEYRRDILNYNLQQDSNNGPQLDTAVLKVGGCWQYYKEFFQ